MSYFTEDLLESIKNRSLAPISQSTFDDDKLLLIATEQLKLKLTSDLIKVREDFFIGPEQVAAAANQTRFAIPSRAIGSAVKSVWFIQDDNRWKLTRTDEETAEGMSDTSGIPRKFYIEGDEIVISPAPASSGTIEFKIPVETNDLVATSTCAKITASTPGASTVVFTVNTDLTESLSDGDYVDFLSASSPFKLWSYRVQIVSISATQIEVATSDVSGELDEIQPEAGDYICPTGTSCIPQIPIVFHSVLAQMVVVVLMESLGDLNKKTSAENTLERMRQETGLLIKNRVESSPQKVSTKSQLVRYFR